ncbi:II DNA helicase [Roridomyces roridus]|uniref:DNA 3'-5' helicase n=1 Tax=Roridomyces roridus TaxID=1738132 RepID=A0AAD7AXW2_9AGAR|nr:II DNA helicase [Roridomyces roridus]
MDTYIPNPPLIPPNLHELTPAELKSLFYDLLPQDTTTTPYIESLSPHEATESIRACIIAFFATPKHVVPRPFQLQATVALSRGRDVIVDCGTGSGKTLCQILPNLLHPTSTSITISPLKRLQVVQAAEFERWGIKTVCINEDTPNDPELWARIRTGYYQHLIVQPEQLKTFQGHLPRLARLLDVPQFTKTISRVHVDEGHNHVLAGLPRFGLSAFRPSWGSLKDLRLRLRKGVPFEVLSGTFPPHIKSAVVDHLQFHPSNILSIKLSSNRPNTSYATHPIVGKLSDLRNLNFLIGSPHTFLRKTIVFHDNRQEASDAAVFGMSQDYLTKIFNDFSDPDGTCKILHGTEGASTGIDVGDIDAVIDYGCPQNMCTALQRAGRCGRRGQPSVYIVMPEPWAYTASLDALGAEGTDPDRPISGRLLKDSKKPDRAGLAMILYVRSTLCLRDMIRRYLADESEHALAISTSWCCDRPHLGDPFRQYDKTVFFPGRFLYLADDGAVWAGDEDDAGRVMLDPPKGTKRKRRRGPANRPIAQRVPLHERLTRWVDAAHTSDPLRAARLRTFILSDADLVSLATAHPDRVQSVTDVVAILQGTAEWEEEWGAQVFEVISTYDAEIAPPATRSRRQTKKKKVEVLTDEEDGDESSDHRPDPAPLSEVSTNVRRTARNRAPTWKLRPQN